MAKINLREIEKKKLIHSVWFPLLFLALLWLIKGYEVYSLNSLSHLGLYPLKAKGLWGILTAPLIHSNWQHLINNSIAIFFLTWAVFYFYSEVAWKVFAMTWFMNGFWLWFFGRQSYHIGASGLIYGFGAFLFLSGLIRRNRSLLAIALLDAFLYGSLIWGIFPMEENVSWESHLTGLLAGIVLSVYYRQYGPPANIFVKPQFEEEEEEEEDDPDDENPYWIVRDENGNIITP